MSSIRSIRRRMAVSGGVAMTALVALTACQGPSTATEPYVVPVAPGVNTTSLLTVADAGSASNGYEMVGIPDGLGARRVGGNTELFMNHELRDSQGVVRAHGQKGAFVSKYTIDPSDNEVVAGSDLIQPGVQYYDYLTDTYASTPNAAGTNPTTSEVFPAYGSAFARFCSGSLTAPLQLANFTSGNGTVEQIFFANEENGNEGRVFGVTTSGQAKQLPRLGLFSWENTIAAANRTDTTVVMGNEDASGGQLWVYAGTKQNTGDAFDKAGLTNGTSYVVRVGGGPLSDAAVRAAIAGSPTGKVAFDLTEVPWNQSGAEQNAEAAAEGLTLTRIEDGAFDPKNRNAFYFLTTEGGAGAIPGRDGGGLWRLTFTDVDNPLAGGTLELLLDGSEAIGLNKPDNLTFDDDGGVLLIQEDPGNNAHVARIVAYRTSDGATATLAEFDRDLFDPAVAGPNLITADEESSGIIDVSDIHYAEPTTPQQALDLAAAGRRGGKFLFDAEAHTSTGLDDPTAQVERGQLLLLNVVNWNDVF